MLTKIATTTVRVAFWGTVALAATVVMAATMPLWIRKAREEGIIL